jgi:hypothetical protein
MNSYGRGREEEEEKEKEKEKEEEEEEGGGRERRLVPCMGQSKYVILKLVKVWLPII